MTRRRLALTATIFLLAVSNGQSARAVTAVPSPSNVASAATEYLVSSDTGNLHTKRAKARDVKLYLEFLAFKGIDHLNALSSGTLNQYAAYRLALGDAPATAQRRLATAHHFSRSAFRRAGLSDTFDGVRAISIQRARPKWFDGEAGRQIREAVALEPRDALIVELMYRAGLRRAEVCDIEIGQLDRDNWLLKDVRRKGKKYQDIWLSESVQEALALYLPQREKEIRAKDRLYPTLPLELVGQYPLLISVYGAKAGIPFSFRMSDESIRTVVTRIKKATGLRELTAHRFRHSFVRDVYKSTDDILVAKEAAGHSNVNTTFRYAVPDEDEVKRAVRGLK